MNKRITTIGLLAAALLAVLTLAAACGGGGDGGDDGGSANGGGALTLQQYLERLEQLSVEYNGRTDAIEAQYNEDIASIETDADGIRISNEFLRTGGDAITVFVDGIDELDPPAEAREVHDASVSAGRAMATGIAGLADELDDTTTRDEYNTVFEDSGVIELGDAFEQACFDTQDLADANSIDVSFDCSE